MSRLYNDLLSANIGKVRENEPLLKHTTIKIGGPADLFVEPSSSESLAKALQIIKKHGVKWRAIGRGSNLLVSDKGIEGVVLKLGIGLDDFELHEDLLTVGGGCSIVRLATIISKKGLSGLEFASGIPGSIGGAVYMNAGAHGSDISKILVKAQILFDDGRLEWLSNEDLEFSYRTSVLQEKKPGICLNAVLKLEKGVKEDIVAVMQKNKDYRKVTQPWNFPCAGSIFRNPLPKYAGQLVEDAGLKGYQIGGAKISEMHGNFIVNAGDATAQDVLDLIAFVKETILEKYGVTMETEVEIIGRK
ncbi:UDP-N-acetylmuramate dehydrogenase [Metabacillus sediminilitoris]|jgi:UDP-N-acetylmuramate dehydrogenase|uniref:UDP-N-acetylenolpyruvoylglucosamine reductase n=1 Tax=Metabacillus sediminilitoris TaxID=2567941 RepID=A0A4S4C686_9BACI|nr:UDP-N-acetylmuramate dehydrogenase [Metabacillus sediminilitoris]QGQ46945.1 UDP-N-acetylmuramate dehydrogenase [Metabacillus sediminilitoris]THF83094.1 UDP-N-acetylmuramate dehydrogenase [Metabacillus sediminilitoris]